MRQFALVLLMELLIPAACWAVEPATLPATQPTVESSWGEQSAGLRARIRIPARLEQNMALAVELDMQSEPRSLPPEISRFNAVYFPAYLRMSLFNTAASERIDLTPYDPTLGMLPTDTGFASISLNGDAIAPQKASFPLRGHAVPLGEYDCVLDYASDRATFMKRGAAAEPGWWSGKFRSGLARIRIDAETRKTISIQVPTRIRGIPVQEDRWKFDIGKDDVETVMLPVRNGCFIGVHIRTGDGELGSTGGFGSPPLQLQSFVDALRRNGSSKAEKFTVDIFETPRPPMHMWNPEGDGYRILWRRDFDLTN